MALTINPAVGRGRHDWIGHGALFVVGAIVGALAALAVIIALTAAVSAVSPAASVAAALFAIVWAVLHDIGLPTSLPYRQQQVPETLRDVLPPSVVAAVFGAMLGFGFLTFFTYSVQLAVLLVLPYVHETVAIATVIVFALGKAVVLLSAVGAETVDVVGSRFHWTQRGARVLRGASVLVSATLALLLLDAVA